MIIISCAADTTLLLSHEPDRDVLTDGEIDMAASLEASVRSEVVGPIIDFPSGNITAVYTYEGFTEEWLRERMVRGAPPGTGLRGVALNNRFVLVDWLGITISGSAIRHESGRWDVEFITSPEWSDPDVGITQNDGTQIRQAVRRRVPLDFRQDGGVCIARGKIPIGEGTITFIVTWDGGVTR